MRSALYQHSPQEKDYDIGKCSCSLCDRRGLIVLK